MNEPIKSKKRLFLIDIIRVLCAFQIFMYHSNTMYGCSYGHAIDALIRHMASPVMTCFFLLSGFSIHYQHMDEEVTSRWIREYLVKRLISIMPSYLLVVIIWPFAYPAQLEDWIVLLPIDLFGVQTVYHTLFGILHNGGTWFVSCLLLAYVLYPVIKSVISIGARKKHTPVLSIVIVHFLLMYSSIIIPMFSLSNLYSNPIARAAEFMIGVSFAEILFRKNTTDVKHADDKAEIVRTGRKTSKIGGFLTTLGGHEAVYLIIILLIISAFLSLINREGIKAIAFGYMVTPVVLAVLLVSSRLHSPMLENNKILFMLSGMSYQFFLTQHFLWLISAGVLEIVNSSDNNVVKIVTSFVLCFVISFLVYRFYDKPIKNALKKWFCSYKLLK